eukprot:gene26928-4551_t
MQDSSITAAAILSSSVMSTTMHPTAVLPSSDELQLPAGSGVGFNNTPTTLLAPINIGSFALGLGLTHVGSTEGALGPSHVGSADGDIGSSSVSSTGGGLMSHSMPNKPRLQAMDIDCIEDGPIASLDLLDLSPPGPSSLDAEQVYPVLSASLSPTHSLVGDSGLPSSSSNLGSRKKLVHEEPPRDYAAQLIKHLQGTSGPSPADGIAGSSCRGCQRYSDDNSVSPFEVSRVSSLTKKNEDDSNRTFSPSRTDSLIKGLRDSSFIRTSPVDPYIHLEDRSELVDLNTCSPSCPLDLSPQEALDSLPRLVHVNSDPSVRSRPHRHIPSSPLKLGPDGVELPADVCTVSSLTLSKSYNPFKGSSPAVQSHSALNGGGEEKGGEGEEECERERDGTQPSPAGSVRVVVELGTDLAGGLALGRCESGGRGLPPQPASKAGERGDGRGGLPDDDRSGEVVDAEQKEVNRRRKRWSGQEQHVAAAVQEGSTEEDIFSFRMRDVVAKQVRLECACFGYVKLKVTEKEMKMTVVS